MIKERKIRSYNGMYRGLVMDTADSSQLGRIKVREYPMFKDLEAAVLPWAVPAYSIVEGAGSDMGHFAVPSVGTFVFVFFEAGDKFQPVYFAEAPTATKGLPSERTTNYPRRKVVKFASGIVMYVDDTDKWVRVDHPTGTYGLIDTDGNIILNPNATHRVEVNAFARTVETKLGGTLNGDDGGLIVFTGPVTFVLPNAADYPGMEYLFVRIDAGLTPATVGATIEPNPLMFREMLGQWSKLYLVSGGDVTGYWHVF